MNYRLLPLLLLTTFTVKAQTTTSEELYRQLQTKLASGWNTWNTRSVLSHVLLPQGLAVNIGVKSNGITSHRYLQEAYISPKEPRSETVVAGYHAYDGRYTECTVTWEGTRFRVESAHDGAGLVILLTPLKLPVRPPSLVIEAGMLWNRPGTVSKQKNELLAQVGSQRFVMSSTAPIQPEALPLTGKHLSIAFDKAVGVSVGTVRTLDAIQLIVSQQRTAFEKTLDQWGTLNETYLVQQSALAWNMIYDPELRGVTAPVSRFWNTFFGGQYVLFDWDTYLSAYMAGLDNRALAYANVVEATKGIDRYGMVPNYTAGGGLGSPDRSQPPVGSLVMLELYRQYQDRWLLDLTFDRLLRWNRWWPKHRDTGGLLCWGSDNLPPDGAAHSWQGAAYESGLDNSPMYDGVPFNPKTNQLQLADVGLTSLYIADCKALAEVAKILNRTTEVAELQQRADRYSKALQTLWQEERGMFLNRRTDTGQFSDRLSPTLFYPLLAGVATPEQARRMVKEHLLNPDEFWGEWVLPSVARNDPAFKEQNYWRGRIWAPLNFLVYLGLRNYDLPDARKQLVEKSNQLLLKNWRASRSIPENFHASGVGRLPDEALNRSDSFYHWGALMGFMSFLEHPIAVDSKKTVP
ncbi:MGH1-like glycoside hydrolase domain-containing protein [Larkinella sp. GY13]|uniref:MGH1-like glycoside hydrolase domain-containing protein n=1 Tax=Larkinella sp. GY13 TaxID=3453720 RepID=UPI003EF00567